LGCNVFAEVGITDAEDPITPESTTMDTQEQVLSLLLFSKKLF
jgi:hypothetical protein